MATTTLHVKPSERVEILDLLRGIALFGILMVNMPLMNTPFSTEFGKFALWQDIANLRAGWIIDFFFTGKFYTLFSMLFGIGFYYFMQKAIESGSNVLLLYKKRLMWLLAFGIVHVVLLWYGDILVFYAIIGFLMILFRNLSNKGLIIWSISLLLTPLILMLFFVILFNMALTHPVGAVEVKKSIEIGLLEIRQFIDRAMLVYSTGTFVEIMRIRLEEYINILAGVIFFLPNVLAMFLTGILLARKKVFEATRTHRIFFKRLFWICLPVAVVGNWLYATMAPHASSVVIDWNMLLMMVGHSIGGPAMTFVYISIIVYIFEKNIFSRICRAIMASGRMAFTNYLAQSIIATTIFFSYGLGLYGQVNIWQGMILTVVIYVVQVIGSLIWLRYYQAGPLEWVWRKLTYGREYRMNKA